jgi:hypothetical protein
MNSLELFETQDTTGNQLASTSIDNDIFSQHIQARTDLVEFMGLMKDRFQGSLRYLEEAAAVNRTSDIFDIEAGFKAIDAEFWDKALKESGVLPVMSSDRRTDWKNDIAGMKTPEFIRADVINTVNNSLDSRSLYLAERIDAAFNMLSPNHLTNSKWGFSDRMIIEKALDKFGYSDHNKMGKLDDLRTIIGSMLNRNTLEQSIESSSIIVEELYSNTGTWTAIDAGAMRIKAFQKGTIHLEIHPDISARLNEILAIIHPLEIPSASFKPKKNPAFCDIARSNHIGYELSKLLESNSVRKNHAIGGFKAKFKPEAPAWNSNDDLKELMLSMGGVDKFEDTFHFDYDPEKAINRIIVSGTAPDWKSHQFYPTKDNLATVAALELDITESDTCLEPSAGQGGLAMHLNANVTCIELAALNCSILKAKGFKNVIESDFITWANKNQGKRSFSKVLMNPPFTKNQAKNHVMAAADLLTSNGKLAAILPASLKGKELVSGFNHKWSDVFADQFDGTAISVVILTLTRT